MATPSEKLASSLAILRAIQDRGVVAIRGSDLSRVHRERLRANGFLQEVMKGWYIASRPEGRDGDTTAWYTSFWGFCAAYLDERFKDEWCLSPEQSVALQVGNRAVPHQLIVRAPRARNHVIELLHGTSRLATTPERRIPSGLNLR